jgi:hypothetical protein
LNDCGCMTECSGELEEGGPSAPVSAAAVSVDSDRDCCCSIRCAASLQVAWRRVRMNSIGPITDTDPIAEFERESAEDPRVLFLRRQNSTKVTITATSSKAAAPPPMALATVLTGDVFCDVVNDVVDVFDNMVDISGVVRLVLDDSDDALCTVRVRVTIVADGVIVVPDTTSTVVNRTGSPTACDVVAIVPLLMPLMIIGGERRQRRANALKHVGEL